jgi:cytochrome c oxidase subunit II
VDGRHHEQIAVWERRWIALSGLISLTFVVLIAYSLATEGAHIGQLAGRGSPDTLLSRTLFAEPGVRVTGPGAVQVSIVAQAFAFVPERVEVPQGAEVTLYLTARDVIHGYQVEGTNLNAMVIPGEIVVMRYTFNQPGSYRVTCNEYCGIGHHQMLGEITVVPPALFGRSAPESAATMVAGPAGVDGAAVYAANCASCHGPAGAGIAGVFPPVAVHAAELAAASRPYLVDVLLYGLQGPIEVRGTNYNGVMPAFGHLGDEQLAAVLDHIISLGGPEVAPFTADEVAAERGRGLSSADVLQARREAIGR